MKPVDRTSRFREVFDFNDRTASIRLRSHCFFGNVEAICSSFLVLHVLKSNVEAFFGRISVVRSRYVAELSTWQRHTTEFGFLRCFFGNVTIILPFPVRLPQASSADRQRSSARQTNTHPQKRSRPSNGPLLSLFECTNQSAFLTSRAFSS